MQRFVKSAPRRITRWAIGRQGKHHGLVGAAELRKMNRDFQIRFLKDAGLLPEHYLHDTECGTFCGGMPVIEYVEPGHDFGTEVHAQALEERLAEIHEAGPVHKSATLLFCDDMSKLVVDQRFSCGWPFSVLKTASQLVQIC